MEYQTTFRQAIIRDCTITCPDFLSLYLIFRATLYPAMSFKAFRRYYYAEGFEYIDATFIECNNQAVGFCAAAFYRRAGEGKRMTIARAATGIMADCRGHRLPKWSLYYKYIRYKWSNPSSALVLTGYIANPLVYAMICKYTGTVYPKPGVQTPTCIRVLKEEILAASRLNTREDPEFVVKIHFQVNMGEDIIKRVFGSDDVHIRYFLSVNPRFQEQFGLMVIIPVTWENILGSARKFISNFYRKEKERWKGQGLLIGKDVQAS